MAPLAGATRSGAVAGQTTGALTLNDALLESFAGWGSVAALVTDAVFVMVVPGAAVTK
jgi:hypothetical protein